MLRMAGRFSSGASRAPGSTAEKRRFPEPDVNSRARALDVAGGYALLAALLAGLAVLAAGCGGEAAPPAVPKPPATSGPVTTQPSSDPPSAAGVLTQEEAYAHCMRRHGILDFPDPTPD